VLDASGQLRVDVTCCVGEDRAAGASGAATTVATFRKDTPALPERAASVTFGG